MAQNSAIWDNRTAMRPQDETISATATPSGEGGIAVIRVSGAKARAIAETLFRPLRGDKPDAYRGYTVRYGSFLDPVTRETIDDGLLTLFRAPRSYTGEDCIELSCHGGRAATARLLQATLHAGARLAEPGEFTLRAFLNGRIDLAQAEAVADLIRARTESARRLARVQLEGSLSQEIAAVKDDLTGILAAIEVTIDFSDEAGELEYAPLQQRICVAKGRISRLLATGERGRILREGLRVAIVGRPNVGKSSLLNALLRADRAIVAPIAGTTRDVVEESANISGVAIVLADTAGIRDTEDVVERIGVERARAVAETADVILLVIDIKEGFTENDSELLTRLKESEAGRVVCVLNKSDNLSPAEAEERLRAVHTALGEQVSACVALSAKSGEGIDALENALLNLLGDADGQGRETVMVANERHCEALRQAQASLVEAENSANLQLPGDFVSIDVRGALDALGLITGETVMEDVIHRIFHDFCVGK